MTIENTTIHFFYHTGLPLVGVRDKLEAFDLLGKRHRGIDIDCKQNMATTTVWFSATNKKYIHEELDTFVRFVALAKELTINEPELFYVKYDVETPVPFDSVDEWKFVQNSLDLFVF